MLGLGISSTFPFEGVSTDLQQATSGTAAGLQLWLKNDTDVTAAQWKDSSGNDNHAAQSTEGNQAAVSGGGLDFEEGNSTHYDLASTITIAENQGFCIAIVMDQESVSNNTILSKDADDQIQVVDLNRFRIKTNVSTTTTTNFDIAGAFNTGKMLVLINRSAGATNKFTIMKNGATLTPDTDTSANEAAGENPFGFDINVLGTRGDEAQFFDGKILELAFWDRALTLQEITDVNSYLQSIHGL
jgi:hypothetical protein